MRASNVLAAFAISVSAAAWCGAAAAHDMEADHYAGSVTGYHAATSYGDVDYPTYRVHPYGYGHHYYGPSEPYYRRSEYYRAGHGRRSWSWRHRRCPCED